MKCKEMWIQFSGHGQGQHLTLDDSRSAYMSMYVTNEGKILEIAFRDKDDALVKLVAFNINQIREWSCEQIIREELPKAKDAVAPAPSVKVESPVVVGDEP
jgi:hypothetical protein